MKNSNSVTLEKLTSDVVKITIQNNKIKYQGGQYLTLCIPKISYFEWHPFSIQTSSNESNIEIYCKKSGNWTKDLLALAENLNSVKTKAFICGPYGYPSIDIAGDYYKSFVLVGGGIGITPIISTCKQLLEQRLNGRPITQIFLIWTTRNQEQYQELLSEKYIQSLISNEDKQLNILQTFYHHSKPNQDANQTQDLEQNFSENENNHFITTRPSMKEYLSKMYEVAKKHDEKRVGVMVCGPSPLIKSVQDSARSISNLTVRFDVHEEVFAL